MAGPKIKGSKAYRFGYHKGKKIPISLSDVKKTFSGNIGKKLKSEILQRHGGSILESALKPFSESPATSWMMSKKMKKSILKKSKDFKKGLERGKKEGKSSKKLAKKYFRGGLV